MLAFPLAAQFTAALQIIMIVLCIASITAYIHIRFFAFIYKQVSDGTLYARINRPAGVVSFLKVRTH
jgi:hypothetical protein